MIRIYEIRNKGTHRIEYLNLYNEAEEKPDDAFRRNPDCLHFAGRPDIYLSLREESFEDKDKAWAYCMNLWVEYKLMSPEKLQENIETPRVQEKSEIQETEVVHNANPGSETAPTPEVPKKSSRSRKPKTDKK